MFGRMLLRLLALVALVAVLVVGGGAVYQLGVTEGVAQGVTQAAGATTQVVLPYGYGGGFGFFGFLAALIFLVFVFRLARAILFGGRGHRHGMHGGWGRGWQGRGEHHDGPGGGWTKGPWAEQAREHLESWHRDAHGEGPQPGVGEHPADAGAR